MSLGVPSASASAVLQSTQRVADSGGRAPGDASESALEPLPASAAPPGDPAPAAPPSVPPSGVLRACDHTYNLTSHIKNYFETLV